MGASKLYLITRGDLPCGAQASQLAHALRAFVEEHPEIERRWFHSSNTLALLAVDEEGALEELAEDIETRGIAVARFHEPDLDGALTAIAVGPEGSKVVRGIANAFR